MIKHHIRTHKDGALDISVEACGDAQTNLLKNFKKCQSGKCDCPSDQFDKIERIDIQTEPERIHMRLEPKAEVKLDVDEVDQCLTWSKDQVPSK